MFVLSENISLSLSILIVTASREIFSCSDVDIRSSPEALFNRSTFCEIREGSELPTNKHIFLSDIFYNSNIKHTTVKLGISL